MASWYDKNIIPQSGFGAETEGSPMLTFTVGVAIGALGMYAWQNRDELKRHVNTPKLHNLLPGSLEKKKAELRAQGFYDRERPGEPDLHPGHAREHDIETGMWRPL